MTFVRICLSDWIVEVSGRISVIVPSFLLLLASAGSKIYEGIVFVQDNGSVILLTRGLL